MYPSGAGTSAFFYGNVKKKTYAEAVQNAEKKEAEKKVQMEIDKKKEEERAKTVAQKRKEAANRQNRNLFDAYMKEVDSFLQEK